MGGGLSAAKARLDSLGVLDVRQGLEEAALPQDALPELHAHDPEDEEDEEAEQQHVPQHRQRVQQQHHQYPHACEQSTVRGVYMLVGGLSLAGGRAAGGSAPR